MLTNIRIISQGVIVGLFVDIVLAFGISAFLDGVNIADVKIMSAFFIVIAMNVIYILVALRRAIGVLVTHFIWRSTRVSLTIQNLRKVGYPKDAYGVDWVNYAEHLLQREDLPKAVDQDIVRTNGYLTGLREGSFSKGMSAQAVLDRAVQKYLE